MKTCTKCATAKQASEFYAQRLTADGLMGACKVCHRKDVASRRRGNPEVQAYDRARGKTPARRAHSRAITLRWRAENPEAYAAQTAVGNALRDGKLRREPCLFCAAAKHVHAHHRDYAKPLDVIWLCAKCHHRLHATFPEAEGHRRAV